ncbi:3'(2'),5'-bisphosphate nucleotidase CysQ family protein [Rickettsia endosymbiont of Cardiosporidium cionae]|uniref:3'(2'),5'-bisphosphate nucleotidase CysQ family protein n=1 Tax=Rickettsia endosymbiont of Cardiosporidium cionae TaxID=2777155 RepID=UPI001895D0D9|nr:inositol monophosphatase family protein [Rickettsia endosymbiont of Cardiosporidium cionae]KAF8818633.1 3'(2'),5'-bisphosphate nucleotidase CysQ [Rickettsia endosymbiont of Cardiosporidium cionae]
MLIHQTLIKNLKEIITEAGDLSINIRNDGLIIKYKKDNTPVTNADIDLSDFIYKNIKKMNLNIPIICEERASIDFQSDYFWLIDPIDGTKGFINQGKHYTVNIALIYNQNPIFGMIYLPVFKNLYFTDHEQQLIKELNNNNYFSSKVHENDEFIGVIGTKNTDSITKEYMQFNNVHNIKIIPSSIKLCLIADGTCDIYPKFGHTMAWDTAAGHALINATGGKIVNANNTNQDIKYRKNNFANPHFIAMSNKWIQHKYRK